MTRPGRAGALVAVVCLAALWGTAAPSVAARSGRLIVTDMTGLVDITAGDGAGDLRLRLLVENDGREPLGDGALIVEVHDAVGARSTLSAALDEGEIPTPRLHRQRVPLPPDGPLRPGDITGFTVTVEGRHRRWAEHAGVYPVRLRLFTEGRPLQELVTAVVAVRGQPSGRLLTTVVWPLTDEPGAGVPEGRLDRILTALEERPDARVLLAPGAHLLEDLGEHAGSAEGTALLDRIEAVATHLPLAPVTSPYADVALPWLMGGGAPLVRLAGTAVAEGRRRTVELSGRAAAGATTLVWDRLTPEALDVLSGAHLLAPYEHLRGPEVAGRRATDLPPLLRTLRSASGRTVTATVADPYVAATLADPDVEHGTSLAAQRTLAETAMIFFQAPHRSGRPLLVLPPPDWAPPAGFAPDLLRGLTDAPWLRLEPPDVAVAAADGLPPAGELTEPGPQPPPELRRRIGRLQARLEALTAAVPADHRSVGPLADQLMRAASGWLQTPRGERIADRLDAVESGLEEQIGSVTIPVAAGITLTSDRGEIPVTVRRQDGAPLRVRVQVESGAGLDWPQGRQIGPVTLRPGSSETVSFPVRALSRGRVPVTVTVTDPSGVIELGRARLAVRSTTIGTPALAAVATVVLVLLGVGIVRNRPRRRHLEAVE